MTIGTTGEELYGIREFKRTRRFREALYLNPYAERFVRSIKSECLNKMIIFGERHLRYVVNEYMEHYHTERPHQGIGNNIIDPLPQPKDGEIVCHERLGGLLKSYRRAA